MLSWEWRTRPRGPTACRSTTSANPSRSTQILPGQRKSARQEKMYWLKTMTRSAALPLRVCFRIHPGIRLFAHYPVSVDRPGATHTVQHRRKRSAWQVQVSAALLLPSPVSRLPSPPSFSFSLSLSLSLSLPSLSPLSPHRTPSDLPFTTFSPFSYSRSGR